MSQFPKLVEVQIELSGICNAHCGYCMIHKREVGKQLMEDNMVLPILFEAERMGVEMVTFHGIGESLLHPRADLFVWRANQTSLNTRLSTNCFNLSEKRAEKLASCKNLQLILAIPWVEKPKFVEKCIENAKKYLESGPLNKEIIIQMVCAEGCEQYVDRMLQEFLPYGVGNTRLYFKQPLTWPNSEPVKGFIPPVPVGDKYVQVDTFQTPVSLAKGCTMPDRFLMVLADGTCVPCCVGMTDWGLGKIQGRTLKEVWESERMEEIRRLWRAADNSVPCGRCKKRGDTCQ